MLLVTHLCNKFSLNGEKKLDIIFFLWYNFQNKKFMEPAVCRELGSFLHLWRCFFVASQTISKIKEKEKEAEERLKTASNESRNIFEKAKTEVSAECEKIITDARKKAESVVSEAQQRSDALLETAKQKADKTCAEIKESAEKYREKSVEKVKEIIFG